MSQETMNGEAQRLLPEASGSAFLLVKLCPDGKTINLRMESEAALREHVEAMWRYTNGYHLVAVVPSPNASGQPRLAQEKP